MLYVETLPATDIDNTGFMAHGRNKGGAYLFDWADSKNKLFCITNHVYNSNTDPDAVETRANHIPGELEYIRYDGWNYFYAWIPCNPQTVSYYRAVVFSDGS